MAKRNTRRPQARKQTSRLGTRLVDLGVQNGTYVGGRATRTVVNASEDD